MPEFNLLTNTDWRILNVIRQNGEVDRGYIIKETGATLATVSSSLNRLLGNKNNVNTALITKKEMPKKEIKAGPAPILYSVIPEVGYFLGISVGISHTRLALIDFDFQVVKLQSKGDDEFCFETGTNMSALVNNVRRLLLNLREQRPEIVHKLLGIGFACEGAVDCVSKIAKYSPAMPFIKELNAKEILGPNEMDFIDKNKLTLAMDNIPNCVATAELQVGNLLSSNCKDDTNDTGYQDMKYRARKEKHIICLNIDDEISVSLILNGKIYRGMSNYSGCIEHFFVDVNYEELKKMPGFSIKETDPYHQLGYLIANSIGKKHDDNSVHKLTIDEVNQVYEYSGTIIGKSLSYIVNLLNPELIVLTGRNAEVYYNNFYPQIRESLGEQTWRFGLENLRFEKTLLSSNSAAIGAAINAYFELVPSLEG